MFSTQNDLSPETRERIISVCAPRLADLIDLQSQAKQAHWNVKGPAFFSLHELFDKIAEGVTEYVDEVAERIVQLGGVTAATVRDAARTSSLPTYPTEATDGTRHVSAMSAAIAATAKNARAAITACEEHGDAASADLFTEIVRGLDKWLWFVEAHAQGRT